MPLIVLFVLDVKPAANEVHAQGHRVFHEECRLLRENCLGTRINEGLHASCLYVDEIESLGARAYQERELEKVKSWHRTNPVLALVVEVLVLHNSDTLEVVYE